MATDIKLNAGNNKDWIEADCSVLSVNGADLILDAKTRRGDGAQGGFRRALVHGHGDVLQVNFNHDYKGGTAIAGARLNLFVNDQAAGATRLPKRAALGDLCLIRNKGQVPINNPHQQRLAKVSLWLCTGTTEVAQVALWSRIALEDGVAGDLE
jgi:hypothetical protein